MNPATALPHPAPCAPPPVYDDELHIGYGPTSWDAWGAAHRPAGVVSQPNQEFFVALQVRDVCIEYISVEQTRIGLVPIPLGDAGYHLLPASNSDGRFYRLDCLKFYRLGSPLLAKTHESESHRDLREAFPIAASSLDPVIHQLGACLMASMETGTHFTVHLAAAIGAHLALRYGTCTTDTPSPRGALAPWQEKRAKAMIDAQLDSELSLATLANECKLSVSHFARAFRRSTGCPPHRWLLNRRIERSQDLLLGFQSSLADVALASGFSDQSHFTRVFTQQVGMSPGAWRRMRQP